MMSSDSSTINRTTDVLLNMGNIESELESESKSETETDTNMDTVVDRKSHCRHQVLLLPLRQRLLHHNYVRRLWSSLYVSMMKLSLLMLLLLLFQFSDRSTHNTINFITAVAPASVGGIVVVQAFTFHDSYSSSSLPVSTPILLSGQRLRLQHPIIRRRRHSNHQVPNLILHGTNNNNQHRNKNQNNLNPNQDQKLLRLNKVFKKTHSRRGADKLIAEYGRVSVNGIPVETKGGCFVIPFVDEITLDGTLIEGWEEMNSLFPISTAVKEMTSTSTSTSTPSSTSTSTSTVATVTTGTKNRSNKNANTKKNQFEYIKYWKPRGVICTTDPNIPNNIIDELRHYGKYDPPHRVYPVGRLDKDTSGLILLTSDGRLPNAALRKEYKRPKIYELRLDDPVPLESDEAQRILTELQSGVVISTETVRNGIRKTLTAPTEPCVVEQINDVWFRMTLKEGRNRQVRKMTTSVGYQTLELERVSFAGITLEGLRGPGEWEYLSNNERDIVQDIISVAAESAVPVPASSSATTTTTEATRNDTTTSSNNNNNNNRNTPVVENSDEDNDEWEYTTDDVGW